MDKSRVFEEARKAAWVSIWTLVGIGVAEMLVSAASGSLTLFADGLDSLADALVSFIVWFGIRMLQKPRSKLFHFGYAKIESFAAFVAAVVILVLGAFIVYHAYERILNPVKVEHIEITMLTLAAAGGISIHRAFKVRKVAKEYNLVSLNLDAKNSIKDGTASFVGLASVAAAYFGIPYMDSVGSILIAVYIFFMSATAFKESTLVLIDAVKNPELQQEITRHIESRFKVKVEKILLRPVGQDFSAQVHVELDRNMTLDKAHETLTSIRNSLIEDFKAEDAVVIPKPV
ncbi:MAG TPA: cation diffusion facilitator family transporter [Nitrososphaera sp.]|nr:cation diffusion facilitator family transporter [Nitrososphaera sp.]